MVIICPNSHEKWNYVKLELVRILLRIGRLSPRNSYMVFITPVHMKSWPKSKLGSNIAQNHLSIAHGKSYLSLIAPIHMKMWVKM